VSETGLRERKKQLTRAAIIEAAERLFEARGYDAVTVAEIADAANVSVKTLFVYFRSKEELAFADTLFSDTIVDAVAGTDSPEARLVAVRDALLALLDADADAESADGPDGTAGGGIEAFHRAYGDSEALTAGLRRYWAELEDRLTAAIPVDGRSALERRLEALRISAVLRTLTSPEMRAATAGLPAEEATRTVRTWLAQATSPTRR
jgi:AcrR family transcriptional regulator